MKKLKYIIIITCTLVLLTGCKNTTTDAIQLKSISDIHIPEDVNVVGLGEATHGNSEFTYLKRDVFKILVEKYNYRAFALESDFGGASLVNDYISNSNGTATEAAYALGFRIYKTNEMVDVIQWMHDYNQKHAEDPIRFYGYDMQRYDASKEKLFIYLETAENKQLDYYKDGLKQLTDDTVYTEPVENIKSALQVTNELLNDLDSNKEDYINITSQLDYELSYQYAQSLNDYATIRGTDVNYWATRDQIMAKNVQWILNREKTLGNGKLFIAGHNGHIEKTSASIGGTTTCMGEHLTNALGSSYYTIGTEFRKNAVLINSRKGRDIFTINNKTKLTKLLANCNNNVGLIDFSDLQQSELARVLNEKIPMGNLGDDFSTLIKYVPSFRQLKLVPTEAYDSLIYIDQATPTTLLD